MLATNAAQTEPAMYTAASAFGSSSCNAERISGHTHTRSSQRSETDDDRMIVIMPDPNTSTLPRLQ